MDTSYGRTVGATKLKAHLLSVLDDVEEKREQFVVTRNGKAIARVIPMPSAGSDPIFGFYAGKLDIVGDVLSPLYSDEELDEFEMRTAAQLHGTD